jgi:hypothetical protein
MVEKETTRNSALLKMFLCAMELPSVAKLFSRVAMVFARERVAILELQSQVHQNNVRVERSQGKQAK